MAYFGQSGSLHTGHEELDVGISDLEVHVTAQGTFLYSSSGANGGIAAFELQSDGSLTMVDYHYFQGGQATIASADISVLNVDGTDYVVTGVSGQTTVIGQSLGNDGEIGSTSSLNGLSTANETAEALLSVQVAGGSFVYTASVNGDGLSAYRANGGVAYQHAHTTQDTETAYAQGIVDMAQVQIGTTTYVIAASGVEHGVSCYEVNETNGSLQERGEMGAAQGVGINTPTAMEVVSAFGSHFVVLASAESSSLTVMEVQADGSLVPTDHILDTLGTRFDGVTSLETIEVNGQVYVMAGGADDGVSLFSLAPNGQLVYLDSISETHVAGLNDINSIVATHVGDTVQLFVAAEGADGLISVSIPAAKFGNTFTASAAGGVLNGSKFADFLSGGDGDDIINGGKGNDIVMDGAGSDQLRGGNGQDIFMLTQDGQADYILDFKPNEDRLDLSSFAMLYQTSQLTYQATATGAILTYRGEATHLTSALGSTLSLADIFGASGMEGPSRPIMVFTTDDPVPDIDPDPEPDPNDPVLRIGGSGADTLEGGVGNDELRGNDGNDILRGFGGNDLLLGGALDDKIHGGDGDDEIRGGTGFDVIYADAGNDRVWGDDGRDVVYLGDGNDQFFDNAQGGKYGGDRVHGGKGRDIITALAGEDRLFGDDGNDELRGGNGNDFLRGGRNNDVIYGEAHNDEIYGDHGEDELRGGDGIDTVYGGDGHDLVFGGNGDDTLWGGTGHDRLHGSAGYDVIHGESGDDRIWGDDGRDTVFMGTGNDIFYDNAQGGQHGGDTVHGGAGNDEIRGGAGQEVLHGDDGEDLIYGGIGNDELRGGNHNDRLYGGAHHDTLFGGNGWDKLYGEGGNDIIWGGNGNDLALGDDGDDVIHGEEGNDELRGNAGDDKIYGGNGEDILYGSDGADEIHGGNHDDFIHGGNSDDLLYGGGFDDEINGGIGNDRIHGGSGYDLIYGGSGADLIWGDNGADEIHMESGNDTFYDNAQSDDHGADTVYGGDGRDRFFGGGGNDTLSGGAGVDSFIFFANNGRDRIVDFALDLERIEFRIAGLRFQDLNIFNRNGDAVVDYGSGQVILEDINANALGADDFIFAS